MWKRNLIKTLFIFLSLDVCCAWNPRLYPYDPRIHNFGNHGAMGSVHSLIAPLFTLYTDTTIYGRNLRKEIVDSLGADKTILDVGCGTGFSTSDTPGSKGVDVSKEMLSTAKAIFPNKDFEQGDIEEWIPDITQLENGNDWLIDSKALNEMFLKMVERKIYDIGDWRGLLRDFQKNLFDPTTGLIRPLNVVLCSKHTLPQADKTQSISKKKIDKKRKE